MRKRKTFSDLFDQIERAESGCWLWIGYKNRFGYGQVCRMIDGKAKLLTVHRLFYRQYKGEIPDGLQVRHTCDMRNCCNPEHMLLGTQADNMADMKARGRHIGQKLAAERLLARQSARNAVAAEIRKQPLSSADETKLAFAQKLAD